MAGRKRLAPVLVEGKITTSTEVKVGGALTVNVVAQPSTVATTPLTGGGGMAVIGSTSTLVYTLPTSTAGTLFYVYWSSGAASIISPADTTNTKIWGFPSTGKLATTITGTTGDHLILIAQSSSQWNILSHTTGVTSSS